MPFRTHNFSLRLTDQEIASYERLAGESGVSVSEWARSTLNKEVDRDKMIQEMTENYRRKDPTRNIQVKRGGE